MYERVCVTWFLISCISECETSFSSQEIGLQMNRVGIDLREY